MPKRKLSDFESTPQTNSSNRTRPSIQVTRLNQLFDQGVQSLSRALKTARGFERQKLGKREQKAKKEKDAKLLERIGEEIGALKVCFLSYSFCLLGALSLRIVSQYITRERKLTSIFSNGIGPRLQHDSYELHLQTDAENEKYRRVRSVQ